MTKLNDYKVTLHLRCRENPNRWIVDEYYNILDLKNGEDILYWNVEDIKEETKPNPPKSEEQTNTKEEKSS